MQVAEALLVGGGRQQSGCRNEGAEGTGEMRRERVWQVNGWL
jgi:hypothetical protein